MTSYRLKGIVRGFHKELYSVNVAKIKRKAVLVPEIVKLVYYIHTVLLTSNWSESFSFMADKSPLGNFCRIISRNELL